MIRVVNVRKLRTPAERMTCVYVGRKFAGWPASPWGNPFRPEGTSEAAIMACLDKFTAHAISQPKGWLDSLWLACDQGKKPLGCWCVDDDGTGNAPRVCHAQILRDMLTKLLSEVPK